MTRSPIVKREGFDFVLIRSDRAFRGSRRQRVSTSTGDGCHIPNRRNVLSVMGTTNTQQAGRMELVQSRFLTSDVAAMAHFYAALVDTVVVTNDYYVEVPTPAQRIGVSRMHYSDLTEGSCGSPRGVDLGAVILDFAVDDLDAEHDRIWGLDVDWLMLPTLQPWGRRSMMLRDPEGHVINVFEKKEGDA